MELRSEEVIHVFSVNKELNITGFWRHRFLVWSIFSGKKYVYKLHSMVAPPVKQFGHCCSKRFQPTWWTDALKIKYFQLAAPLWLHKVRTTAFRIISEQRRTVKEIPLIVWAAEPHAAYGELLRSDRSHQQLLTSSHSSRFLFPPMAAVWNNVTRLFS